MNYVTYQSVVVGSLADLYSKVINFIPSLLAAAIVLILGWLLATFLSTLVWKILEAVKIDHLANQLGLNNLSQKVGRKLSLAVFGGWLVKWFFFLGSIMAASSILGLNEVSDFVYTEVLGLVGRLIMAMVILLLGILVANFLSDLVGATVKASGLNSGASLASLTKWTVLVFSIIAALHKLEIAETFLNDLFRGVVAMLALAAGLAFGLGGKEHASKVLDKIESNLSK